VQNSKIMLVCVYWVVDEWLRGSEWIISTHRRLLSCSS